MEKRPANRCGSFCVIRESVRRRDGIKRVFYQSQFPRSSVETVCEDIGAEAVEINPLDEEIFGNIRRMVYLITEN